ncbi:MAG: hypothetical protein IPP60_11425 [Sphingobacteriales bacterium]|nr:hypothetical protein [Sphingobacteriales bacterium]
MKKSILLTFVLAAGFVATFLTGCGTDSGPTCNSITGRDTGIHIVYLDELNPGITPIRDTLDATISGDVVTIQSKALGKALVGKISSSNCNLINLDSFFIGSGPADTLRITTTSTALTLQQNDGVIRIWNVRAGGTGTITSTGATTKLSIAKGNTNITSLGGVLQDLSGRKLNLRGSFLKLP